jgi:penicillin amidase
MAKTRARRDLDSSRSVAVVVSLLLLAIGCSPQSEPDSLDELARRSLAQIGGELDVPGLREPVEVIRDEWGIPHIYAQNVDDLFLAQGYVMAQDRLWQMEMWRRWHEGRLSEIFGPAAFDYDLRTRQMMFRGPWDESEWTSYHPDGERIFTAYANGVNAFIEQNRDNLPVEFQLTGVEPDPWTAKTVVLRWAQVGLSSVRGHAISELQLAMNVGRFGAEEANRRAAPDPWDDLEVPEGLDVSIITQEVLSAMRAGDGDPFSGSRLPDLEVVERYRHLTPAVRTAQVSNPQVATEGSNNWVMSGDRSPTGVPILANDPHRRIEMPALRYFVHLNAPGWNVIGGGEPPFVGVDAGNNERMAWGFTFAGTDMVDLYVEEVDPDNPDMVRWQDGWEPLRVIEEEIGIKGEAPRTVELKFSRHGPVIYEDTENHVAYAVRSVVQDPGTAAYKGSFKMAQAESCEDFFERAMYWMVPTHSLICADVEGNIALQVTGLTPDRDGWNGRLPVPGSGKYEWQGFRSDLPREFNPARGYIATANNNVHPPDYEGRPVFYHRSGGARTSRITRLHQILGTDRLFSVEDHQAIQLDAYSLRSEGDIPAFQSWTSDDPEVERARALIAEWDGVLTRESTAAAIYVQWTRSAGARARNSAGSSEESRALTEEGLEQTITSLTEDWGADWAEWRYGRGNQSGLRHMFIPDFDLPAVERPGGFGTVNATGANFRRIIDLSDLDRSVATNAPGQSAQPGSPFYGNLRDHLGNGEYFPLLFSREAVEGNVAHRLMLNPAS